MSEFKGIIYGGKKVEVCDQHVRNMVTDAFSVDAAYAAGDCCIYDNTLYRFTTPKDAGAWDPESVQAITIAEYLSELNSRIEDLTRRMGGYTFYSPPLTEEEYQSIEPHDPNTIYPIKGDD